MTYFFQVISWHQAYWLFVFIIGSLLLCFPPIIFAFLEQEQQLPFLYLKLTFPLRLIVVQCRIYPQEAHLAVFARIANLFGLDADGEALTVRLIVRVAWSTSSAICILIRR